MNYKLLWIKPYIGEWTTAHMNRNCRAFCVGHTKQAYMNHSALYPEMSPCQRGLQHFSHHLSREHILDVQPPQKRRQIIAISILIQKLVKKFTGAAHVQNASNSRVDRYKVRVRKGNGAWPLTSISWRRKSTALILEYHGSIRIAAAE